MTVQSYQTYRSSGADYLGDVPAHWDVRPLKHLASFTSGNTPSKERPEFWGGEIPWASAKDLKLEVLPDTADHITKAAIDDGGAQLVPEGAILVLVRGMMLARMFPVCVVGQPMAINQDLKALRPRAGMRGDYLAWLLRGTAPETLNRLDEAGHGTKALRMDAWASMKLPVPPASEQEAIAAFLDQETAKIDVLVDAQQRLIELLKEKRQAATSRAVTKGVDTFAPMKDSGVEWLGDVPAHWNVARFSRCVAIAEGQVDPRDEAYASLPLIAPNHIESGTGHLLALESASDQGADSGKYKVVAGDVVYSKIRPHLAKAAIAPSAGLCSADMYPLRSRGLLRQEYLLQIILCPGFTNWATLESERVAMPKINREALNELKLPVPPLAEQDQILRNIEAELSKIDPLLQAAARTRELLQERRAALISAAVTGKIDVRGWTAAEVRTAVAAEIIRLHARKPTFGRVKNQKLLYLAEAHAGITEIGGRYDRRAAGPYDADLIAIVERDLEAAGVMAVSQPEGAGSTVSYSLNRSWKADNERLKAMLGGRLAAFEQVNAKLADLKTRDAEAVATLYAVWNDALLDGEACDDARVIRGFLDEWHPEKREKFKQAELHTWLGWMRRNGIVPSGRGPRTGTRGLFA